MDKDSVILTGDCARESSFVVVLHSPRRASHRRQELDRRRRLADRRRCVRAKSVGRCLQAERDGRASFSRTTGLGNTITGDNSVVLTGGSGTLAVPGATGNSLAANFGLIGTGELRACRRRRRCRCRSRSLAAVCAGELNTIALTADGAAIIAGKNNGVASGATAAVVVTGDANKIAANAHAAVAVTGGVAADATSGNVGESSVERARTQRALCVCVCARPPHVDRGATQSRARLASSSRATTPLRRRTRPSVATRSC